MRCLAVAAAVSALLATTVSAAEIVTVSPSVASESVPRIVAALARRGLATQQVQLSLKDAQGRLRADVQPAIAVVESAAWSPDDPARDGASEFEVLLCTARLLSEYPLSGFVTVGNRHGALLPGTESALHRVIHMGLPVVRLARDGNVEKSSSDLLIAAGDMTPAEAQSVLGSCLLRYGALPPANDPARPTHAELTAIRERLSLYQESFDVHASARLATMITSEAEAVAAVF